MLITHYLISFCLTIILCFIFFKNIKSDILFKILFLLILLNLFEFNGYLILTKNFNPTIHLPLHLCYLTQIGIFISMVFNNQLFYPLLLLNSFGGGITGFLNSNLSSDAIFIEHLYLHLSHFNLLFFVVILHKKKYFITKSEYIYSIFFNALIFIFIFFYNILFNSNYWFTKYKPMGINLTNILPTWPYYLIILIMIGLSSYYLTFKFFSKTSINKKD